MRAVTDANRKLNRYGNVSFDKFIAELNYKNNKQTNIAIRIVTNNVTR